MASITSLGAGSGLDLEGLVTKLMATEQQPVTLLQSKSSKLSVQVSAYGQIKSSLSSFQDAANAFLSTEKYSATAATSSDNSIVSATSNSTAAAGSYSIKVLGLTQGQRVTSAAGSSPTVAAGTLTIQLGTYTTASGTTSFTAGSTAATPINFTGSSLTELRDAINSAKTGVTASIVNDGSNDRLVMASNSTGATTAFKITGTDGLASLSYDASTGATSTLNSLQTAQDASAIIQGITVTRTSNAFSDVIPGVTLNLASVSSTAANITVSKDSSQATALVQGFIKAYNDSFATITTLTSYDSTKKVASTLTGDTTATSARNTIRNAVTQGITLSDGTTMRLQDLGVTLQKDGTLKLEYPDKLSTALSTNASKVSEFLGGTTTQKGLGKLVSNTLDSMIGVGGTVVARTDGLDTSIKSISKQIDSWSTRLTAIEARYRTQFSALDTAISSMKQTSSYLTQQLASLPGVVSK
jgi:flagellar hook-associated protein 2